MIAATGGLYPVQRDDMGCRNVGMRHMKVNELRRINMNNSFLLAGRGGRWSLVFHNQDMRGIRKGNADTCSPARRAR